MNKQANLEKNPLGPLALVEAGDLFIKLMQESGMITFLKEQIKNESIQMLD
jgi:hypothetical protein